LLAFAALCEAEIGEHKGDSGMSSRRKPAPNRDSWLHRFATAIAAHRDTVCTPTRQPESARCKSGRKECLEKMTKVILAGTDEGVDANRPIRK
jgi:hypothetical protein